MTAYLQPGDKIHVSMPGSVTGTHDRGWAQDIRDMYAEQGIEVVSVTVVAPNQQMEIISVIRPRVGRPRSMEKLKLVDLESDLPWQDSGWLPVDASPPVAHPQPQQ